MAARVDSQPVDARVISSWKAALKAFDEADLQEFAKKHAHLTAGCWRRHVFDLGADFGLTHLNSWRIRLRKRFDRRSAGSMKSRHLGQKRVGGNILSTETPSSSIQKARTAKREAGQGSESEKTATGLREVLRRIAEDDESASVLVLGRYRYLKQRLDEAAPLPMYLNIEFSTVHSAKGREADYAVLVDVVTGRLGFPSEIEDDPIMNLVLANMAGFPNAEERRVFYVALTRARIKSFVVSDDLRRSAFIDELEGRDYEGLVIGSGAAERAANCPVCESGRLQLRTGPYGPFYACVSERCGGKAAKCPHCGGGGFLRNAFGHTCLLCGKTAENCPNCTRGYLKHIPGGSNYQAFDACPTNSRNPPYRCFVRNPCQCPPNPPELRNQA